MIQIVVGIVLILLHIICCILSCMGGNLYSYYKCKEISHVPGRFCSGVGIFVCVDPAFSDLDTIRSEKRSRRREDEGK